MDEFEVKEELKNKRKEIKTFDDLIEYLKEIKNNYNTGYGTAPRAIAQAILATGYFLSSEFGITGFQASCTMWDFIRGWMYPDNKIGMKLMNYDDMLYPQYEYKFDKTLTQETWDILQKVAKEKIETETHVHPKVLEHWYSIAEGNLPFGFTIRED